MNVNKLSKSNVVRFTGSTLFKIFRILILAGTSYVVCAPILKIVSMSFINPHDFSLTAASWIPANPTFVNYKNFLYYYKIWDSILLTARFTIICTLIQAFICSLVGYGLARYPFKGNGLVFVCVLFTIIMPITTAAVPAYVYYRFFDFFSIGKLVGLFTGKPLTVNLVNTTWSYYVPAIFGVGLNSGLFIFLFRQFFKGMPKDLEDAGRVDGCGPFKIYWRIMVPNIKPVFVTVMLLSSVYYWNDSVMAGIFMNGAKVQPVMAMVNTFTSFGYSSAGVITNGLENRLMHFGGMVLAVLPLLVIFLICQKFFIESMDRSGIKG